MNSVLALKMKARAHFVAGRHPRQRESADENVRFALNAADVFLASVGSRLPAPAVSGGTTSNPDVILRLFWNVRNVNDIVGVYVTFGAKSCAVSWVGRDHTEHNRHGLTADELIALNVPAIFRDIEREFAAPGHAPKP